MSTSDAEVGRKSSEIVRSSITTWNEHDTNVTMELLDPEVVFQSPLFSDPVRGIPARTEVNANFMTSMPDFAYRLIRMVTTLSSASAGPGCRAGRSSAWPSPASCYTTLAS